MVTDTRRTIASVLAALGLLGSAALIAYDIIMRVGGTAIAGLAILLIHLFFGWIPALMALLGLTVRANGMTITSLIVSVLAFAGPLALAVLG
jgi:hypothetical protein